MGAAYDALRDEHLSASAVRGFVPCRGLAPSQWQRINSVPALQMKIACRNSYFAMAV